MSVLIKDMKMPHNCGECWIPCTVEFLDRQLSQRPKCCPCFEVKIPHGRLIDADTLTVKHGWLDNFDNTHTHIQFVYANEIYSTPTIIESEEEND